MLLFFYYNVAILLAAPSSPHPSPLSLMAASKSPMVQRLMKDMAKSGVSAWAPQEEVLLWAYTRGLLDGVEKCKRHICALSAVDVLQEAMQQAGEGVTVRGGTMAWLEEEASGVDPGPEADTSSGAAPCAEASGVDPGPARRPAPAAAAGTTKEEAASGVDPGPGQWRRGLAAPPLPGFALGAKQQSRARHGIAQLAPNRTEAAENEDGERGRFS